MSFFITFLPLAVSLTVLALFNVAFKIRNALHKIGPNRGFWTIIGSDSGFSDMMGDIPYISPGREWSLMKLKHSPYSKVARDIITWVKHMFSPKIPATALIFPPPQVQIYPTTRSYYIVADPYAIKEIVSNRAVFPKNTPNYQLLNHFGTNLLTTEGEEWKRQRKLASPAFSEKNKQLVWDETIHVIQDMFDNWGPENKEISVDHCLDITIPLCKTGFGRRISWSDDKNIPSGHHISFQTALRIVANSIIYVFVFPRWVLLLTKKFRNAYSAKDEFVAYIKEMIERRRANLEEERYDILNALLKMNEESIKEGRLREDELLGNNFILLLAGHETTAHTMCFTLGLLAIEQEEQEVLFQHIIAVLGDKHIPLILSRSQNYEEFNKLTYVMAVINESLRLFPPVITLPKVAAEDTAIPIALPDGRLEPVFIPKGMEIYLNTSGLHYNPRYWDDPNTFNPSRFRKDYNKDAFIPFSAGARGCIGRGFAETELIAAITMIIRNYRVELKNPELYAGMNKLQQREKLLANRAGLTVTCVSI
ncbi:hypothetical protein Clacol_009341 [Clathrus columnatus]|uniref:Cytochrome P450 n=1 Tax=Clathrus columnatus TaxID=1419009 RepID=A0AAV5ART1_9AGAM|nr:hypothetical protein Clacol_009341 [Clathrus columnatus]